MVITRLSDHSVLSASCSLNFAKINYIRLRERATAMFQPIPGSPGCEAQRLAVPDASMVNLATHTTGALELRLISTFGCTVQRCVCMKSLPGKVCTAQHVGKE